MEAAEFGAAGTEVRAYVPLSLAQRLQPLRLQTAAAVEEQQRVAAAANGANGAARAEAAAAAAESAA